MERARPHVQLGVDPGGPQGARERHGLVAEHLGAAAVDVRAGEPGQVLGARGCRVRGDVVGTTALAEVGAPAEVHRLAVGDADAVDLPGGHGVVAVVEHRGDEDLREHLGPAPVTSEQDRPRRQAPARALPGHHDARRVDAELVGVLRDPDESGVAVLDGGRVGVLRGEAVVHADEHDVVVEQPVVVRVEVAEVVPHHHPAAVDRVDARGRTGPAGALDHREVDRVAAVAGDGDAPPLEAAGAQSVVELLFADVERAHPGQGRGVDGERSAGLERGEEDGELGVEGRSGRGGLRHGRTPGGGRRKWTRKRTWTWTWTSTASAGSVSVSGSGPASVPACRRRVARGAPRRRRAAPRPR